MTPAEIDELLAAMFRDVRDSEALRGRAALVEFVTWGAMAQQLLAELDAGDGIPEILEIEDVTEE